MSGDGASETSPDRPDASDARKGLRRVLAGLAALAVLCLVVWAPVLSNGWVWRDVPYVSANLAARDAGVATYFTDADTSVNPAWQDAPPVFRPLRLLSYRIDFELGGLSPRGAHAHGLLLHFVNSVLLLVLVRMLGMGPLGAIFVAMLFLVHPAQSEAVCWAVCRDTVMATTWVLLGVVFSLWRFRSGWRWFDTAGFCAIYLGACLASPQAVLLPVWALLLGAAKGANDAMDCACGSHGIPGVSRRALWSIAAASALVVAAYAFWVLSATHSGPGLGGEFGTWLRIKAMAMPRCLGLLLVPGSLTPDYSDLGVGGPADGLLLGMGALVTAAVLLLAARCWRIQPMVTAGLTMLVVGLFAAWRGEGWFFGERMLYMPMAGFVIAVGFLLQRLAGFRMQAAILAAGLLVVLASIRSTARARDWANGDRLLRPALEYAPDNTTVLRQLMRHYLSAGDLVRAPIVADGLTNALSMRGEGGAALAEPLRVKALKVLSSGEDQLGRALLEAAAKADPRNGMAYLDMGMMDAAAGRPADGIPLLRKACELMPYEAEAFIQLGVLLDNIGQTGDAEASLRKAADLEWVAPKASIRLAELLLRAKRGAEAEQVLLRASRRFPGDVTLKATQARIADGRGARGEAAQRVP